MGESDVDINEISGLVVDAAIKVHRILGPGLLERTYAQCLAQELRSRGLKVRDGIHRIVNHL